MITDLQHLYLIAFSIHYISWYVGRLLIFEATNKV